MQQVKNSGVPETLSRIPAILAAFVWCAAAVAPTRAAERPNIIVILADDLGSSDVSAYNPAATPLINTPSIDALAAQGIRFTDGRTPDGVCTPTRYGLLTGQYSWRTELKSNVLYGYDSPLIDSARQTVASMLQGQGYNTAVFGKWHLGLDWVDASGNPTTSSSQTASNRVDFTKPLATGPAQHGFDTSIIYPGSLNMAPFVYLQNGQTVMADGTPVTNASQLKWTSEFTNEFGGNVHTGWAVNDFVVPDVQPKIADDAAAYVTQQATDGDDSPFFMYVPFTGPHKPVAPSGDFDGANPGANTTNSPYGEFMADIDESVRKIVDAVDAQGQEFADNTLIIFSADNGAHQIAFGPNGEHIANAPYRDKKMSVYDGGTRVPFIARWGEKVAPGQVIDERVGLIDLFGTFADIVGHQVQQDEAEDTASFANILLKGDTTPIREGHVYHSFRGSYAIGSDEWKLLTDALGGANAAQPDPSSWQLYNLDEDVDESDNLIIQHPNKAVELGLMIARYEPDAEDGRSRTHRQMLTRFDLIGFQAGRQASADNPDLHELTTTNRLALGVSVSQGIKKGAGLAYADNSPMGGGPQTLLDDPFDNGDPTTGGTNGGFVLQRNSTDSDHTLSESAGRLTSTFTETTFNNPNGGPVSISAFGSQSGLTISFEVDSVSGEPTNNGLFLGVVDSNSGFYRNLDNIGFSFFGNDAKQQSAGGFSFLVNDRDGDFNILDTGFSLDWSDLADGFTAQMTLDPSGWSYVLTGVSGSAISNSGVWTGGSSYSSVFDGQEYAVASLQKDNAVNATLVLDRVTVTTPNATVDNGDRGDEFHLEGFDGASLAQAKANGDYVSFALEIEEGQQAEDLLISFDLWRHDANSATHYAILTSADGFDAPIGELAFAAEEHGINLGIDYSSGDYGVGNAQTLSGLLDLPAGVKGTLEIRLYGYSDGESLAGSTHLIAARVEGLLDVPGDYDGNGLIDVGDYQKWRETYGSTEDLAADGNRDGRVDAADYAVWRNAMADAINAQAASPAPEPAALLLGVLAAINLLQSASCR